MPNTSLSDVEVEMITEWFCSKEHAILSDRSPKTIGILLKCGASWNRIHPIVNPSNPEAFRCTLDYAKESLGQAYAIYLKFGVLTQEQRKYDLLPRFENQKKIYILLTLGPILITLLSPKYVERLGKGNRLLRLPHEIFKHSPLFHQNFKAPSHLGRLME